MANEIKLAKSRVKLLAALNDILVDNNEKHDLVVLLTNFLLDLANPAVKFTLFQKSEYSRYTVINTCKNIDVRLCGLIKQLKTHKPGKDDTKSMWISGIKGLTPYTIEEYEAEVAKLKDEDEAIDNYHKNRWEVNLGKKNNNIDDESSSTFDSDDSSESSV